MPILYLLSNLYNALQLPGSKNPTSTSTSLTPTFLLPPTSIMSSPPTPFLALWPALALLVLFIGVCIGVRGSKGVRD